jgi:sarcosine oxidase subunit delta
MLLIDCPWCGPRDETEFRFAGEAAVRRPTAPECADAQAWADYLYTRENRRGRHRELWCHVHGCGQFLVVERDTVSHAITATATPGGAA